MPEEKKLKAAFKRERQIHKEIGVTPALAGAAVYEGIPRITRHLLRDVPSGLTDLAASGKPITAAVDTPLARIAEFTRAEVKAIKAFAHVQKLGPSIQVNIAQSQVNVE